MSDIVERLTETRESLALAHVEIGALNAEIEQLRALNAELLEVLHSIENTSRDEWDFIEGHVVPRWRTTARAAIAKAEAKP